MTFIDDHVPLAKVAIFIIQGHTVYRFIIISIHPFVLYHVIPRMAGRIPMIIRDQI